MSQESLSLVAIDFSRPSRAALEHAAALGGGLLLLHVIHLPDLEEVARLSGIAAADLEDRITRNRLSRMRELLAAVGGLSLPRVETMAVWGTPFREVLCKAREFAVDRIVIGSAGQSADIERVLFGSTAEKVLRGARCPVICVPAEVAAPAGTPDEDVQEVEVES